MVPYFSYGSNMDPAQMVERCPGSVVIGRATLPDHEFRIAAGGYGTVVPSPGAVVHGILWNLPEEDEAALDVYEDLANGFYRKVARDVTAGGAPQPAMMYVAADPTPGRAVPGYQEKIVAAAIRHGFPAPYVDQLKAWVPPAQPDR